MARSTTSSSTQTPEVTADAIRKRVAELQALREKAIADANAFSGAIQDCQYWLSVLEAKADG